MSLDLLCNKLGYKNYKEYRLSLHWKNIKSKFFKSKLVKRNDKDEPCCTICMCNIKLEVHHKSYKSFGKENLNHLILVCHSCHGGIHRYAKLKKLTIWRATKLYSKLNK